MSFTATNLHSSEELQGPRGFQWTVSIEGGRAHSPPPAPTSSNKETRLGTSPRWGRGGEDRNLPSWGPELWAWPSRSGRGSPSAEVRVPRAAPEAAGSLLQPLTPEGHSVQLDPIQTPGSRGETRGGMRPAQGGRCGLSRDAMRCSQVQYCKYIDFKRKEQCTLDRSASDFEGMVTLHAWAWPWGPSARGQGFGALRMGCQTGVWHGTGQDG